MPQPSKTLRTDAGRLRYGLEDFPDAAIRCAIDGTVEEWNRAASALVGFSASEALGRNILDLALPASERSLFETRFQTASAGKPQAWTRHALLRKGAAFWGETLIVPAPGMPGTIVHIRDASRTKLKDEMANIQSAITAILVASQDLDSAIPKLLEAACARPPWDLGSYWAVSDQDGLLRCKHQFSRSPEAMAAFRKRSFELAIRAGQGLPGRVLASKAPEWMNDILDKASFIRAGEAAEAGLHTGFAFPVATAGMVTGLFEFFTRVPSPVDPEFMTLTESMAGQVGQFIGLKKAEQDLALQSAEHARARDLLAVILQGAADGIAAWNAEGRIIFSNEAYSRILGLEPAEKLAGLPMPDVQAFLDARDMEGNPIPASQVPTAAALRGEKVSCQLRIRTPQGEERQLYAHAAPVINGDGKIHMAVMVIHDRTEQVKAEAESKSADQRLNQSRKMEALGRLAGGIAHDFNNLLTAINGYSDLLAGSMAKGSKEEGFAGEIRKAGDRAAALTQQLLAYSRKQVLQKKIFALDNTLREMESLLRRLIPEDIALQVAAGSEGFQVEMDPGQLEQVILNLVLNARDAMPKGGTLRLESLPFRAGPGVNPELPDMRPGDYVRVTITDSGSGMSKDTLAHLFEPFFTTKEPGKGTGLGLSTVYGIVNQAEGQISVDSEPGRGTRFDVYFPALPQGSAPSQPKVANPTASELSQGTILLVEDEAMVRNFMGLVLKASGFQVLEAGNGAEALLLQRNHPGPILMLVSDVIMPAMGGEDLADAIRLERPGIKILFVSGYTARAGITQRLGSDTAFLKKPFTGGVLLEKVRELLAIPAA